MATFSLAIDGQLHNSGHHSAHRRIGTEMGASVSPIVSYAHRRILALKWEPVSIDVTSPQITKLEICEV